MKFILLPHLSDERHTAAERLRAHIDLAVTAEAYGFDGFGIGERHERPYVDTSPPVVLSHIAAHTSTIRLFTTVTALAILDPVRAYEDYATLDNLCGGRLDLIIGKGNSVRQARLFGVTAEDQWDRLRENHALFRRLWTEERVTWSGRFRPPLDDAEALPRPFQPSIRIWHGSATNPDSADLAARSGDPLFSANGAGPIETYAALVRHYRERWAHYGNDPTDALVGAGTAGYFGAASTGEAVEKYRPVFAERQRIIEATGLSWAFTSVEDVVANSSALVGSPADIVAKVQRYHAELGHEVMHISVERELLGERDFHRTLALFRDEIAPALRDLLPSRPLSPVPAPVEESR